MDCGYSGESYQVIAEFIVVAPDHNAENAVTKRLRWRFVHEVVYPKSQSVILYLWIDIKQFFEQIAYEIFIVPFEPFDDEDKGSHQQDDIELFD